MDKSNVVRILEQSVLLHEQERGDLREVLREMYAAEDMDESRIEHLHRFAAKLADYADLLRGYLDVIEAGFSDG